MLPDLKYHSFTRPEQNGVNPAVKRDGSAHQYIGVGHGGIVSTATKVKDITAIAVVLFQIKVVHCVYALPLDFTRMDEVAC